MQSPIDIESQQAHTEETPLISPSIETAKCLSKTTKNRLKKIKGPAFSIAALGAGPIGTQWFFRHVSDGMGFSNLALNMFPAATPYLNPMFAADTKNIGKDPYAPGNIRNTFWANTLFGTLVSLASIPAVIYSEAILKTLGAPALPPATMDSLQTALKIGCFNAPLAAVVNVAIAEYYQSDRVSLSKDNVVVIRMAECYI